MKNKTLFLLSLILFFSYSVQGQTSQSNTSTKREQEKEKDARQAIKNFYVSYAANVAHGFFEKKSDTLLADNMTPSLIAKVPRMGAATGADPIIRGQDFNSDDLNSLDVKHLKDASIYLTVPTIVYND